MDDTQMMDVDGDIVLDVDPAMDVQDTAGQQQSEMAAPPEPTKGDADEAMPAAYYESLEEYRPIHPVPEALNLQGVSDFGPNEPLEYALEHCPERKPKRLRWINDNSVNIEYYRSSDAADALLVLTHPDIERAATVPPQESRRAMDYSKKPTAVLTIREANTGDHKERNAADRSQYYRRNPDVREQKLQQRARREDREPSPVLLDYGDEGAVRNRRRSSDDLMSDGDDAPRSRHGMGRRPPARRERSDRAGRKDIDSYRPRSDSPRESRYGRLRGRSASPAGHEGDGRYGFEDSAPRRYRSRSRDNSRRQRSHLETSRWEKDRFDPNQSDSGRWIREGPVSPMSRHRRSDATDETNNKGSLLSRMTKDGKPVAGALGRSLASRITRDGDDNAVDDDEQPRANRHFASRITRDDNPASHFNRFRSNDGSGRSSRRVRDESYGRLKDDDSAPRETDFQDPTSGGGSKDLLNRITWVRDRGEHGRKREEGGFNIKGSAETQPQLGGFSIRGAAGGE